MKKHVTRFNAAFLGTTLLILGLLLGQAAPVQAFASILYVAPAAGCIGTPNCFATVQEAVDLAAPGIEIQVAAGTYTDVHERPRNDTSTVGNVTQVVYITKTVTIRGGFNLSFTDLDPSVHVTTLNAQNLGRVIYITGDISPTIDGLNLTSGNASGQGGYLNNGTTYDVGGGVYVMTAAATLTNNRIFENTALNDGGGVYLGSSTSQLYGNTIDHNHITSGGGGGGAFLFSSAATLKGNRIMTNTSTGIGGGLYLYSSEATLTGNTISDNTTIQNGGGVEVASCSPSLSDNLIIGNTAYKGGGLVLWYSASILTNNVVRENQAVVGSGVWIGGSTPQLLHTTIASNTGGGGDGIGVFVTDDGNTTNSTASITNTILVNQTTGVYANTGNTATLEGVLWHGNAANTNGAGTINILHDYTGDPTFGMDGYHLEASSAAIDKGVSAGVTIDIDGQPRDALPDLGVDEYWAPGVLRYIYLPFIGGN
jgi:parallel beta-helix repeat protein